MIAGRGPVQLRADITAGIVLGLIFAIVIIGLTA